MRNRILVGCAVFLLLLISQAPAGLLRWVLAQGGQAALIGSSGTLWNGSGELLITGQSLGILSWDLQGVTILRGKLSYHVTLDNKDQNISGELEVFPASGIQAAQGQIDAASVNRWLAPYNISLSGAFTVKNVSLFFDSGVPDKTEGEIHWQGGPISYRLANENSTASLPPMTAILGPGAEATVFAEGGQTPLLRAELQVNGFARVGVTKLLTKMLNRPWPGSDADHEVVLEVEEQVF